MSPLEKVVFWGLSYKRHLIIRWLHLKKLSKMTFSSGLSNNHVLMEEVKNIGIVVGCLIVFFERKVSKYHS